MSPYGKLINIATFQIAKNLFKTRLYVLIHVKLSLYFNSHSSVRNRKMYTNIQNSYKILERSECFLIYP